MHCGSTMVSFLNVDYETDFNKKLDKGQFTLFKGPHFNLIYDGAAAGIG